MIIRCDTIFRFTRVGAKFHGLHGSTPTNSCGGSVLVGELFPGVVERPVLLLLDRVDLRDPQPRLVRFAGSVKTSWRVSPTTSTVMFPESAEKARTFTTP